MKTSVIHVRNMQPGDVYVGRAMPRQGLKGSTFGNPFKEGMNPSKAMGIIHEMNMRGELRGTHSIQINGLLSRETAIEFYRVWFTSQPALMEQARRELKGKRLACWCHPKACHADVLAEVADAPADARRDGAGA